MKKTILAAIAIISLAACTKTQERCHTVEEMHATKPAQRLGYSEYSALQIAGIGCNKFAVIVTGTDGQRCGYIMEYKP